MAMFIGQRDVRFFQSVNRELMSDIIDTFVDLYKVNLIATKSNVYEETKKRVYEESLRLPCHIEHEDQQSNYTEAGKSMSQTCNFVFLKQDLVDIEIVIEEGDIIYWDAKYWEISHVVSNAKYGDKDPDTDLSNDYYGWDINIQCNAFVTKKNKPNIEKARRNKNKS